MLTKKFTWVRTYRTPAIFAASFNGITSLSINYCNICLPLFSNNNHWQFFCHLSLFGNLSICCNKSSIIVDIFWNYWQNISLYIWEKFVLNKYGSPELFHTTKTFKKVFTDRLLLWITCNTFISFTPKSVIFKLAVVSYY